MGLEQRIGQELNKHPEIKRTVKSLYQHGMYILLPKIRSEGDIVRLSPNDGAEYFFGYYDKCPWDATGRYVICLRARDTWSSVAPSEPADILLIDTQDGNKTRKIAQTHAWNVQQGCMAQWLGPDFDRQIIYNDFRDGKYCSVILDVFSGEERQLSMPVYSVSAGGKTALTLDFARLHRLRPGYGYSNFPDMTEGQPVPDGPCIWRIDIERDEITELLHYRDFVSFEPRPEMQGAEHKVNHIMISPSGRRFMVLHRWFRGQRKYTRLVTCDIDGTNMYNLSDDDMVSHCCWKNDREILAYESKRSGGPGYYLMKDKTQEYRRMWPALTADGHPSYSPNGKYVVTDTYPDRARVAAIKVMDGDEVQVAARVFAPFKYDNDTRCDLHPRWSRDGKAICFDSVFEDHRGLYTIRVGDKEHKKCRVVFLVTACNKVGPIQQTLNIVRYMDPDRFEPVLVTLYDEPADGSSLLSKFLALGVAHHRVAVSKLDILSGRLGQLSRQMDAIRPDVIHSLGVFPDYAVGKLHRSERQIITLRNYMHDDYLSKFGPVQGRMLERLQMHAVRRAAKVVTCSESLAEIYRKKKGLSFTYIRNGVDTEKYGRASAAEKKALREKLCLPADKKIFVYAASFIPRKDQAFLLETFRQCERLHGALLLLLGNGPEFGRLKSEYGGVEYVDMRGDVANVPEFLRAADIYISASKSEGMPNGVLEAMATGLPVVLSDIEQHKELFGVDGNIGALYRLGDRGAAQRALCGMLDSDVAAYGAAAYAAAHSAFGAEGMSRQYQQAYARIVDSCAAVGAAPTRGGVHTVK